MEKFFTGVCMQICAMLDIANSYSSILVEQFQQSGYEEKLDRFAKQFVSLELLVAKVETIGYGSLFKELARTLAALVHQYAPMRFKS